MVHLPWWRMLAMIPHAGGDTGQGPLRTLRTITVDDRAFPEDCSPAPDLPSSHGSKPITRVRDICTPTAQTTACNGVAPNLLYRWRRLLSEGGAAAVSLDEPVVGSSEVRRLEERVRELERLPGRL
jgi:hypothetical protein